MTENPLYRRVYGYDNPLMQQQYWRPPSNEYAVQYNRNPNAAQDLRNLFGTFFARNAAPQYQQYQPYQTTMPTGYNPAQSVPQPPAGSMQDQIKQTWANDIAPPVADFAKQQALDAGLMGLATGGALYSFGGMAKPYYPLALAALAATRYGAPIANGINKFANSPVGKVFGKVADLIW